MLYEVITTGCGLVAAFAIGRYQVPDFRSYASGGHYKSEDVDQAAAALITLDEFVPLKQLIDRFYPVQHEAGYLEAAGLVNYLRNNFV